MKCKIISNAYVYLHYEVLGDPTKVSSIYYRGCWSLKADTQSAMPAEAVMGAMTYACNIVLAVRIGSGQLTAPELGLPVEAAPVVVIVEAPAAPVRAEIETAAVAAVGSSKLRLDLERPTDCTCLC